MAKFEFKGFDEFEKQLKKMEQSVERVAKKYDGSTFTDISELLNNEFMSEHTAFDDWEEWLKSGGFSVKTQEDFDNLPESKVDAYVQGTTDFNSWQDMLEEAASELISSELEF